MKIIVVPMLLVVAGVVVLYLVREKLATSSGSTRADDFAAGFKAWMDKPLMGNGYNNNDAITRYMSSFRKDNLSFSNSPMWILASGGIYLFILYVIPAVHGLYKMVKYKDWYNLFFYGLFLAMFVITVISYLPLTFYMFASIGIYEKKSRHISSNTRNTGNYLIC